MIELSVLFSLFFLITNGILNVTRDIQLMQTGQLPGVVIGTTVLLNAMFAGYNLDILL